MGQIGSLIQRFSPYHTTTAPLTKQPAARTVAEFIESA